MEHDESITEKIQKKYMKQITITICLDKAKKTDVRDTINAEIDQAAFHITASVTAALDTLVKDHPSFNNLVISVFDVKTENFP